MHAWVEVWDGKQWQAHDSFLRGSDAALWRIKLRSLSFDSQNPYRDLLEASEVVGRLKIDSIDAE